MFEEIEVGVGFLARLLSHVLGRTLFNYQNQDVRHYHYLSDSYTTDVNRFQEVLKSLLISRYTGHWYIDNPIKGQAYRCLLATGSRCDPLVEQAVLESGLRYPCLARFLCAMTIWIDPNAVSYRIEGRRPITREIALQEANTLVQFDYNYDYIVAEIDNVYDNMVVFPRVSALFAPIMPCIFRSAGKARGKQTSEEEVCSREQQTLSQHLPCLTKHVSVNEDMAAVTWDMGNLTINSSGQSNASSGNADDDGRDRLIPPPLVPSVLPSRTALLATSVLPSAQVPWSGVLVPSTFYQQFCQTPQQQCKKRKSLPLSASQRYLATGSGRPRTGRNAQLGKKRRSRSLSDELLYSRTGHLVDQESRKENRNVSGRAGEMSHPAAAGKKDGQPVASKEPKSQTKGYCGYVESYPYYYKIGKLQRAAQSQRQLVNTLQQHYQHQMAIASLAVAAQAANNALSAVNSGTRLMGRNDVLFNNRSSPPLAAVARMLSQPRPFSPTSQEVASLFAAANSPLHSPLNIPSSDNLGRSASCLLLHSSNHHHHQTPEAKHHTQTPFVLNEFHRHI